MLSATMCEHLRFKLRCVALRLTQVDKSSSTYVSHSLHLLGGGGGYRGREEGDRHTQRCKANSKEAAKLSAQCALSFDVCEYS